MRYVSFGGVNLTKLRNYHWEVVVEQDDQGKPQAVIYEVYVVTDEDYTSAPEGQKRIKLFLTKGQQATLNTLFRDKMFAATQREEVDLEVGLE